MINLRGWSTEDDKKEKLLNHPGIPYFFSMEGREKSLDEKKLFNADIGTCPFHNYGIEGDETHRVENVTSWQECGKVVIKT